MVLSDFISRLASELKLLFGGHALGSFPIYEVGGTGAGLLCYCVADLWRRILHFHAHYFVVHLGQAYAQRCDKCMCCSQLVLYVVGLIT